MAKDFGIKALAIAKTQIGVKEVPKNSNTGPRVKTYQKASNLKGTGWPWCSAFFCWCYRQAGAKQPFPSASADLLRTWYNQHGRTLKSHKDVRPGDAVFYDWDHNGVADHVGMFSEWTGKTTFKAVEGNTAVGNDSNGGEVMVRDRDTSTVRAFARPYGSRLSRLTELLKLRK